MSNEQKKQQFEKDLNALKSLINDSAKDNHSQQKQHIIKQSSWLQKLAPSRILGSTKNLTLKILSSAYNACQGLVGALDGFISFVLGRESERSDPVISYVRTPAVFGAYVILIFVIGGGTWAALAPIDSATYAQGVLVYEGHKKVIQHQEGGIVKDILVKAGEHVEKGDPVIILDDVKLQADLANVTLSYRTLLATKARLEAEQNGSETVVYPEELMKLIDNPDVYDIMRVQTETFKSKKAYLKSVKSGLNAQISEYKERQKGLEISKKSYEETAQIYLDRVQKYEKLVAKGIVSKAELAQSKTAYLDAAARLSSVKAELDGIKDKKEQIEHQIASNESKDAADNFKELSYTRSKLEESAQTIEKLNDSLKRVIIKASESGMINELHVTTVGSVIRPADIIGDISPDGDQEKLIIEAKVQPKDVTRVHEGESVKIKFSAFKSRTSPTFKGKVISISADSIQEKNRAPAPGQSDTYYLAKIELDMKSFEKYPEQKNQLRPGMQTDVSIIHGSRTMLQYLLSQMSDQVFRGLNER